MEMSVALEERLKQLGGARAITPHMVRLHMHRTKLDGNRSEAKACDADSAFARDVWTAYHSAIQISVDACVKRFGCCLLLDLQ